MNRLAFSKTHSRFLLILFCVCVWGNPKTVAQDSMLVITDATIYFDPFQPPIQEGIIVINRSVIEKVGRKDQITLPGKARVLSLKGKSVTYGFWNSHIHLMEPQWLQTDSLTGQQLSKQFEILLSSHGFTHAVDLAALDIGNLNRLRNRIQRGEVIGPSLLMAGVPFVPPAASPFYIAPYRLPELASRGAVRKHIRQQFKGGADLIKIWSASPTGSAIINMPGELIQTAARITRRNKKILAAHPTNLEGVSLAVRNGVNLLVHTAPEDRQPWPDTLLHEMLEKKVALIPTLQLYKWDLEKNGINADEHSLVKTAVTQVAQYQQKGGMILFGTDLGYMTNYDPMDEWLLLEKAGLSYRDILATMTTNPAIFFGFDKSHGRISAGYKADLVVLNEDPAKGIQAFGNVFCTIKNGKIIYQKGE